MKQDWTSLDKLRTQSPPFTSPKGARYGAFQVKFNGKLLNIIATDASDPDAEGWEHVSVHVYDPVFKMDQTPTWAVMCYVKGLFWDEDEVVVEFHPAKKDYVNTHDHVLHLWRFTKGEFPTPPKICV